jgi:hypothetical protein
MAEMEGFDGRSALRNVWRPPVFELVAATVHRTVAFRLAQISSIEAKNTHTPLGVWVFLKVVTCINTKRTY